eukprot:2750806-Pleurochrysis_carterae.AAC.4
MVCGGSILEAIVGRNFRCIYIVRHRAGLLTSMPRRIPNDGTAVNVAVALVDGMGTQRNRCGAARRHACR